MIKIILALLLVSSLSSANSRKCESLLGASLSQAAIASSIAQIKSSDSSAQRRVREATYHYGGETTLLTVDPFMTDTVYTKTLKPTEHSSQDDAGTCWIMSQTNVYRAKMLEREIVLPDFKFSTNFVHFFDLLEKANTRLVNAILVSERFTKPEDQYKELRNEVSRIADGGWPHYFAQLVGKYGLVPYSAMPDSYATKNSGLMIKELNRYVDTVIHRMLEKNYELKALGRTRTQRYKEMLALKQIGTQGILKILVTHLGFPPTEFDAVLKYDVKKDGKIMRTTMSTVKKMTPRDFAKKIVKFNQDDFVMIKHYPSLSPGYYQVKRSALGIAISGRGDENFDMRFLNLGETDGSARMLELIRDSINEGIAVDFTSDITQDGFHPDGILDTNIYDRSGLYGMTPEEWGFVPTKRHEVLLGSAAPIHAMAFIGHDSRDGADKPPRRLLVRNSWGEDYGTRREGEKNKGVNNGDFHASRSWVERYVYDISVPRRVLNSKEKKMLMAKPKILTEKEFDEL